MSKQKSKDKSADASSSSHTPVPRPCNDEEWEDYGNDFNGLARANCWITREGPSENFNCVGWSVGDPTLHEWDHNLQTMINWYATKGYEPTETLADSATIDLWLSSKGTFAHASKKYTGIVMQGMAGGLWESTLYPGATLTHGREEIKCDTFAKVAASLRLKAK